MQRLNRIGTCGGSEWLMEAADAAEVADEPLEVPRAPVMSRRDSPEVVEGDYRLW